MTENRPLIIFGTGDIAELAHYYFTNDSNYKVVAFTVDRDYVSGNRFCNLPVIPFDEIKTSHPPDRSSMFVALSYSKLNSIRKAKYTEAKSLGYHLSSYVSSHATVLNEGRIGENCFILEDNTIQPFVTIGNNVTLWSGNHIGHHSNIRDHCFIASHIVVSGGVEIGESCFIGVNATLRDHIKIGDKCIIGAGVLLLSDAEPGGVYIGQATPRTSLVSRQIKSI